MDDRITVTVYAEELVEYAGDGVAVLEAAILDEIRAARKVMVSPLGSVHVATKDGGISRYTLDSDGTSYIREIARYGADCKPASVTLHPIHRGCGD